MIQDERSTWTSGKLPTIRYEWKWSEVQVKINIWTFPISLGVVVFSYTSQIFVPTLEASRKRKKTAQILSLLSLSIHIGKNVFGLPLKRDSQSNSTLAKYGRGYDSNAFKIRDWDLLLRERID
jgi:hypothetical protein